MAKKSTNRISMILSLVALALCLVTCITFFIPTVKGTSENVDVKFSAMEICFVSEEKAQEIAKDNLISNSSKSVKYSLLYSYKSNDDTKAALNTAGWMHFIAMLASLAGIVFIILCMCGKKFGLLATICVWASLAFMIASLISVISFLNVEVLGSGVKEVMGVSAGAILGLITSILASITIVLKIDGKKAV